MKIAPGVFRDRHGLRAYKRTPDGRLRSKRFPPDALFEARRWREEINVRVRLKLEPDTPAAEGSFAADARVYLDAVKGMTSISDRRRDVQYWIDAFGDRPRQTITSVQIRQQLETWRVDHKRAASTLNHRRTALMHLFRVLDGKAAINPVADVPKYAEPRHAALVYSPAEIRRVLARIDDPRARRIFAVFAWTGWPYAQIAKLTKADLSKLSEGLARVTPRRKGAGASGRWLPLLPPAIAALKALEIPDDMQGMHRKTLWVAWTRACKDAGLTPCRPYDLRHAFGTLIAKETHDARAVYELMLHADPKQALRYTEGAGLTRSRDAIRQVSKRLKRRVASGNKKGRRLRKSDGAGGMRKG